MSEPLLEVKDLTKFFPVSGGGVFSKDRGINKAVNGISFTLNSGETLGLVGESGCGKSTAGRTILKLYEPTSGSIKFEGEDITGYSNSKMKPLRTKMQMIFQDPMSSLNPRSSVGAIISASFDVHNIKPKGGVKNSVQELLERVGLSAEHFDRYPHEFSGGQRQRIGIARAIALNPKFIVCDEPVSALDVSIQAQIMNLLADISDEFGIAYLFIAHDLSVVRHISDRVAVMYLGKVMEIAATDSIYATPHHPYTKALISAVPIPDPVLEKKRKQIFLNGELPSPLRPPVGCVFNTRCWKAEAKCFEVEPELRKVGEAEVACHFPE